MNIKLEELNRETALAALAEARSQRDALAVALENVRDCLAHTGGDIGAAAALRAARAALAQVQR